MANEDYSKFLEPDVPAQQGTPAPQGASNTEDYSKFLEEDEPHQPGVWDRLKEAAKNTPFVPGGEAGSIYHSFLEPAANKLNDKMNTTGDTPEQPPDEEAKMQKTVGDNPGMFQAATSMVPAVQSQMTNQEHGTIFKTLDALTIPEQAVARQGVVLLNNVGLMPPEEAKKLLTSTNLMAHDIVNYYYGAPSNFGSRAIRFGVGLAADVVTDPLSYVGIGALTEASKSIEVAGQTFNALDKLSSSQRLALQAASKVEKVISADGALQGFKNAEEETDAGLQNILALRDYANSQATAGISGQTAMKPADLFDGLTNLSHGVEDEAKAAYADALNPKSYFDQWATGDRGFTIGYKIPFTNISKEIDMPMSSTLSQFVGQTASSIIKAGSRVVDNPIFNGIGSAINSVWTKTGFPVWDNAVNMAKGFENKTNDFVSSFASKWYEALKDSSLSEVSDYIENKVYDPAARAEEFGNAPGLLEKLYKVPENETKLNPSEQAFAAESRKILDGRLAEEQARPGLYSERLSPVSPNSANEYLPHVFTEEWQNRNKDTADAVNYAYDNLQGYGLNVDNSNLGRQYRGTIKQANEISVGKDGVKMFVDDPIYATAKRVMDSDRAIRNYDLMQTAADHAVVLNTGDKLPDGYIQFDKRVFSSFEKPTGQKFFEDASEELRSSPDGWIVKRYVPPFYLENPRVALPERVMNDLVNKVNPRQYGSLAQGLIDVQDKFMRIFRNYALFGPGYIGMKMQSDMTTMLFNGSFSNPGTALVDAFRVIHSAEDGAVFSFKDAAGQAYEMSREQIWENLLQHNVIRSGIQKLVDIPNVAENIASTFSSRTSGISNFMDAVNLWSLNRQAVKFAEDIPKVAVWIDRMRGGFSPEAAAEATERLFGNFNNQNVGAKLLNQVFPFTSVAIKTLEGKIGQLANSELAALSVPAKVGTMLQGAFVPDHQTRDNLQEQLPSYLKHGMDAIFGPILPGQYQILAEVPWVQNTMHFFLDPKENAHPMVKLLGAYFSAKDTQQYDSITPQEAMAKSIGQSIGMFAPSWLKQGLQIAEINGLINFGGQFSDSFLGQVGLSTLGIDKTDVKVPYNEKENAVTKNFQNLTQLGSYFEQHRGEDWMYNLIFPTKIDPENMNPNESLALTQRAQYVKQHWRDITLGLSTLTDMDRNVAVNMGAMQRQHQKLITDIKEGIAKIGYLPNADAFTDQDMMREMAKTNPKANEALKLQFQMQSLQESYNWYIGVEKTYPQANPWKLLFGVDKYKYDQSDRPKGLVDIHEGDTSDYIKQILNGQEEGESDEH